MEQLDSFKKYLIEINLSEKELLLFKYMSHACYTYMSSYISGYNDVYTIHANMLDIMTCLTDINNIIGRKFISDFIKMVSENHILNKIWRGEISEEDDDLDEIVMVSSEFSKLFSKLLDRFSDDFLKIETISRDILEYKNLIIKQVTELLPTVQAISKKYETGNGPLIEIIKNLIQPFYPEVSVAMLNYLVDLSRGKYGAEIEHKKLKKELWKYF